MAQIERAILLANATANSISGFRSIIRASHEPGRVPRRETHWITAMAPMMRTHIQWAAMMLLLMTYGAGPLSLDWFIRRKAGLAPAGPHHR